MGEVWDAVYNSLTERNNWTPRKADKLWVSEIGACGRAVALRLRNEERAQPDVDNLLVMRGGIAWENQTFAELQQEYGKDVRAQTRLSDENWSGKPDFDLFHASEKATPIIIEHKAQDPRSSFGKPKEKHLLQLALYGWLYEKQFGVEPRLKLFYRAWGEWAEYDIGVFQDVIQVSGSCHGKQLLKQVQVSFDDNRAYKEMLRATGVMPPYEEKRECRWCGYADACARDWKKDEDTRRVMHALVKAG